jgi:hypothetical protein
MTTVINTPQGSGDNGSGFSSGLLIGILLLIIVGFLVYRYGIGPRRAQNSSPTINVQVPLPSGNNGGAQPAPAQ